MVLNLLSLEKPIILLTLLIALPLSSYSQLRQHLNNQIDRIIRNHTALEDSGIPGWIIGVTVKDSTYFFPYGHISKNSGQAPDKYTLYEIGGLTKVFTSALIQILVEEKKLDYSVPLNNYLPPPYQNPQLQSITLLDVVTHTSGLPRMPSNFGIYEKELNNPYAHYTAGHLLGFYKNFTPRGQEKKYHYSQVNYALLEVVLESQTKEKFISLLAEKVLDPLGLDRSLFALKNHQLKQMAVGYSLSGQAANPWTFQSFRASEGLKSCAADLLVFMKTIMGVTPNDLTPILQKTCEKHIDTELVKNTFAAKGWHGYQPKKYYPVIAHTGHTSGYRAFAGFVMETGTAVVVLSNSKKRMDSLGFKILEMLNHHWKKKKKRKK